MPIDYKKTEKALYLPKTTPSTIDVPEMPFIMIDGKGDPNTSASYQSAVEILYGLSYSVKMSKMGNRPPEGYFDYVVPPLEGLWWTEDDRGVDFSRKDEFLWTSMIRQPEFVTPDVFQAAVGALIKKKPELDLSIARFERFTEGLCAQIMHIGSYDDEPATIAVLKRYVSEQGYAGDISGKRRHHEIYLSDPRKTAPEKRKTVIRHPIK
jgi:hypothetical protein